MKINIHNYSFLIYFDNGELAKINHPDGMDGGWGMHYYTIVDGKIITE